MKPHKPLNFALVVVIDVLVFGALLLGYSYFHHVRTSLGIGIDDSLVTHGIVTKPTTVSTKPPSTGTGGGKEDPVTVIVTSNAGSGTGTLPAPPSISLSSHAVGYAEGLTVNIGNADSSLFEGVSVRIDGEPVSAGAYNVNASEGIVKISEEYFKTLTVGSHALSVTIGAYSANATIAVDPYDRSGDFGAKFAEMFSMDDEIYSDERTYRSHDVYIRQEYFQGIISQRTANGGTKFADSKVSYYMYDVYIRNIENFRSTYSVKGTKSAEKLSAAPAPGTTGIVSYDMLLAVTGDTYLNSNDMPKYVIKNGVLLKDPNKMTSADILVLYYDGVMETYSPGTYEWSDIMNRAPYQVWTFGPALLTADGQVPSSERKNAFNNIPNVWSKNPRSAVGYVEPGHYMFLVVNGRNNLGESADFESAGVNMETLAQIFYDHGCVKAYNFDGGASAQSVFNGKWYFHSGVDNYRNIYDMLGICEVSKE